MQLDTRMIQSAKRHLKWTNSEDSNSLMRWMLVRAAVQDNPAWKQEGNGIIRLKFRQPNYLPNKWSSLLGIWLSSSSTECEERDFMFVLRDEILRPIGRIFRFNSLLQLSQYSALTRLFEREIWNQSVSKFSLSVNRYNYSVWPGWSVSDFWNTAP